MTMGTIWAACGLFLNHPFATTASYRPWRALGSTFWNLALLSSRERRTGWPLKMLPSSFCS